MDPSTFADVASKTSQNVEFFAFRIVPVETYLSSFFNFPIFLRWFDIGDTPNLGYFSDNLKCFFFFVFRTMIFDDDWQMQRNFHSELDFQVFNELPNFRSQQCSHRSQVDISPHAQLILVSL